MGPNQPPWRLYAANDTPPGATRTVLHRRQIEELRLRADHGTWAINAQWILFRFTLTYWQSPLQVKVVLKVR